MPEPAPRAWLELAHDAGYVAGVLEQRLDAAAMRRLGLPLSPVLALRSRCAVAGTVLTARLALEHGIACNTAGGSHHAFAGSAPGSACSTTSRSPRGCCWPRGRSGGRWSSTWTCIRATARPPSWPTIRACTRCRSIAGRTSRPASSRATSTWPSMPGRRRRIISPSSTAAAAAARSRAAGSGLLQCRRRSARRDRLGRLALTDAGLAERERLVLELCRGRGLPLACVVGGAMPTTWMSLARRHAMLHRGDRGAARAGSAGSDSGRILPGFMMFCGSSARLTARITPTRRAPCSLDEEVDLAAGRRRARRCRCRPWRARAATSRWLTARPLAISPGRLGSTDQRGGSCRRRHGRRSAPARPARLDVGRVSPRCIRPGARSARRRRWPSRRQPGPQRQAGVVGVVPRLPEPVALLRRGGPLEVLAAVLAGDLLRRLGLLRDARRRAVELDEQRRRFALASSFE